MASVFTLGLGSCGKSPQERERLGSGEPRRFPHWAQDQGFEDNAQAVRGARIFAQVGCLNCHTYLGNGTNNLGAPDLTAIGGRSPRSRERYAAYIRDPSKFGNQVMPRFGDLGPRNLLALGEFLRASKGER